ncbi:MAG: TadE family type IV pilus minor pilin [Actinomycetes bacterium]
MTTTVRQTSTPRTRWFGDDRGMVTAETALVLPVILLVFAAVLWGVTVASAQLAVVDAARLAARAVARGDDPAQVRQLVARAGPPGAAIAVEQEGPGADALLRVQVSARVRAAGRIGGWLPVLALTATAVTQREPVGLGAPTSGVEPGPMTPEQLR